MLRYSSTFLYLLVCPLFVVIFSLVMIIMTALNTQCVFSCIFSCSFYKYLTCKQQNCHGIFMGFAFIIVSFTFILFSILRFFHAQQLSISDVIKHTCKVSIIYSFFIHLVSDLTLSKTKTLQK